MASRHAAALVILAALIQLAGAPAGAQNAPVTTPPGGPITPVVLPDLAVIKIAAKVACVGGKTVTATIAATIKNQGTVGSADFSKVPLQVGIAAGWGATSGNLLLESLAQTANPQLAVAPPVKPGESRSFTFVIAGIPKYKAGTTKPKQYVFVVTADPKKGIYESNENNNEKLTYAWDPCNK